MNTKPKKDAVDKALSESVAQVKRAKALAELRTMGDSGYFDELLHKENYPPRPRVE